MTIPNGAANSTAIQIQAGSKNQARRRSQPEAVFMTFSRKDHLVGWVPAKVNRLAFEIRAVGARDLGHRVFAAFEAREHVNTVAQKNRAGHGGLLRPRAVRRQGAEDPYHFRAQP